VKKKNLHTINILKTSKKKNPKSEFVKRYYFDSSGCQIKKRRTKNADEK